MAEVLDNYTKCNIYNLGKYLFLFPSLTNIKVKARII